MIEAIVLQNGNKVLHRTYYEPSLTLQQVERNIEMYIKNEQMNVPSDCIIRAKFSNLSKIAPENKPDREFENSFKQQIDVTLYKDNFINLGGK